MKKNLLILLIFSLLFSVSIAFAGRPDFQAGKIKNSVTEEPKNTVNLPARAIQVAPNIFYLGIAADNGRMVEGYAFVHYKDKPGKPTCNDNGVCEPNLGEKKNCADCKNGGGEEPDDSSCYGFLAKGAVWKDIEGYVVNPSNDQGLDNAFVAAELASGIAKWEAAAGTTNIIGDGSTTNEQLKADYDKPDDLNEVYFGDIDEPGVIAVTVVWGIFGGPPFARELVEWDMIFNQEDYNWGNCDTDNCVPVNLEACYLDPSDCKMDFANIAIHELGHSVGMDDLYNDKCSTQTMYGYANYGETKKRDLGAGDINGISRLY